LKDSLIYNKAFKFSIKVVNLYKYLCNEKKEIILSKQLLRSGTSIGANVKEGLFAQSKRDFLSKMNIALKESSETMYWLELLTATNYIDINTSKIVLSECEELSKILVSIVKTTRQNLKNN